VPDLATLADPGYRPPKGPPCSVGHTLRMADPETANLLAAALANPYASSRDIVDALAERGYVVPMSALRRHRRGECRCDT